MSAQGMLQRRLAALAIVTVALRAPARIDVRVDTEAADAVIAILETLASDESVEETDWERLFSSEGYRRLVKREAAMGRPFEYAEFRAFVLSPELVADRGALGASVDGWRRVRPEAAAERALAYLPEGSRLRATIYPMIKPRPNSFVFELESDPAIFFYVDPTVSPDAFENTLAHELHHVGYAAACPDPEPTGDERVDAARRWTGAFGEGIAMLAAAGGPNVHPHATSPPEDRRRWDEDVSRFDEDLKRVERFFLDVLDGTLATDEERLEVARSFYGVQGPWYTVGWKMAAVVEEAFGRERLVSTLCTPAELLALYNDAAAARDEPLATWSAELVRRLRPDR